MSLLNIRWCPSAGVSSGVGGVGRVSVGSVGRVGGVDGVVLHRYKMLRSNGRRFLGLAMGRGNGRCYTVRAL